MVNNVTMQPTITIYKWMYKNKTESDGILGAIFHDDERTLKLL
jgi:hypothetical protein